MTSCLIRLMQSCRTRLRILLTANAQTLFSSFKESPSAAWIHCFCCFCRKFCLSFVYGCSNCRYELDIKCAMLPCIIEPEVRKHQYIHLMRIMSFTCNAWGNEGVDEDDQSPFFCTVCKLSFTEVACFTKHCQDCTAWSSPGSHLICSWSSKWVIRLAGEILEFVESEVNTEFGGYYCPDCYFASYVVVQYQLQGQWAWPIESEFS